MKNRFPTTRWSVVVDAKDGSSMAAHDALTTLCQAYWQPLYSFVRRQGYSPEDAEDLTQGYFSRLIEKQYLHVVESDRGRLRSFLLASLRHFLSDERDRARALKRGGSKTVLSLDAADTESHHQFDLAASELSPEELYERRWALTVVERSLARLANRPGKSRQVEILSPYLTAGSQAPPYRDAAERLGSSVGAVKVAVHRLRRQFGEALRAEVAETVARSDDIDDELRHLLAIVRG